MLISGQKLFSYVLACLIAISYVSLTLTGAVANAAFPDSGTADEQKAYCRTQFDGQPIVSGSADIVRQGDIKACTAKQYCKLPGTGNLYSCPGAPGQSTIETGDRDASASALIPLRTLFCGSGGGGDAALNTYQQCAAKVTADYAACTATGSTAITDPSAVDTQGVANCLANKNPQLKTNEIKTALDKGVAAAIAIKEQAKADAEAEVDCAASGGTFSTSTKTCTPKSNEDEATCNPDTLGGVGWIVCPVTQFVSKLADKIYEFISQFLVVRTDTYSAGSDTFKAWEKFRDIANVMFIIGFITVVLSQVTNMGISNYGIKRMLPRLIVMAILVNLSFPICQIAVDISNVLGATLAETLPKIAGGDVSTAVTGWEKFFNVVLAATGAAAAIAILLLAISLPVLFAALLALVMVGLILLARQTLIILLIVVAPVAIVLNLLPNTEQWYKKWQKLFFSLLMVYPVVGALFGAGALASKILGGPGNSDLTLAIAALAAATLPLFMVPSVLKGSLSAAGSIGAKMQGWGNSATGRIGGKAKEQYGKSTLGRFNKYRSNQSAKRKALIQAGQFEGAYKKYDPRRLRNAQNAAYDKFNSSRVSGGFGDSSAAAGVGLADKIEQEEVDNRKKLMTRQARVGDELDHASKEYIKAAQNNDTAGMKAAIQIMGASGSPGVQKLHETVAKTEASGSLAVGSSARSVTQKQVQDLSLKGKDNSLDTWSYKSGGEQLKNIVNSGDHVKGLSTGELMGHDYLHLHKLAAGGHISTSQAQAVLDDPNMKGMTQNKRELMEDIITSPTSRATIVLSPDEAAKQKNIYG